MQPTSDFWASLGTAITDSPSWMVVGTILVIGSLFVLAKYALPSHERLKTKKLEIEQKQAENDEERIKVNAQLAETHAQSNLVVSALQKSVDSSTEVTRTLVEMMRDTRDETETISDTIVKVDHRTE